MPVSPSKPNSNPRKDNCSIARRERSVWIARSLKESQPEGIAPPQICHRHITFHILEHTCRKVHIRLLIGLSLPVTPLLGQMWNHVSCDAQDSWGRWRECWWELGAGSWELSAVAMGNAPSLQCPDSLRLSCWVIRVWGKRAYAWLDLKLPAV